MQHPRCCGSLGIVFHNYATSTMLGGFVGLFSTTIMNAPEKSGQALRAFGNLKTELTDPKIFVEDS